MAEALLSGDPADKPTLVATGALTNVALLFSVYPEVIDRLSELVIMGGAYQGLGNTGPTAEFNIQCDPEAAHIVFEAGLKSLVMVPLEVTHTVLVTPEIRNNFKGSRFRLLLDELIHFFEESYKKSLGSSVHRSMTRWPCSTSCYHRFSAPRECASTSIAVSCARARRFAIITA